MAFLKASEWNRVKPFSDVVGATGSALLTEFTVAKITAMSHDQRVEVITQRGHGRFGDPTATARAVQEALRYLYPIDPQMEEMVTATLATGWEHIRYLKRLMKQQDQHITRYIAPVPNPVITAGILAEVMGITRFAEHKHVAQYIGLSWEKRSNGNFVSQNTRLTKDGNVYLRYNIILGVEQLPRHN